VKAVPSWCVPYTKHELNVYDCIRPLQGVAVPVYIGAMEPKCDYWCEGEKTIYMMVMSWAGVRPDYGIVNNADSKRNYKQEAEGCLQKIRNAGANLDYIAWRNFLWNEELNSLIAIDFERFKVDKYVAGSLRRYEWFLLDLWKISCSMRPCRQTSVQVRDFGKEKKLVVGNDF
jgi:hypothetical protein